MEFEGFDWDSGNVGKCQKHGMTCGEIESVFARPVLILPDNPNPSGETRFRAIGTTNGERSAFIVFTMRGALIRPVSARHMHKREVEAYEKAYPNFQQ